MYFTLHDRDGSPVLEERFDYVYDACMWAFERDSMYHFPDWELRTVDGIVVAWASPTTTAHFLPSDAGLLLIMRQGFGVDDDPRGGSIAG